MTAVYPTVRLANTPVDLLSFSDALNVVSTRAAEASGRPLAVASINLDHIHHFGTGSAWNGALEDTAVSVEWLNLIDGAPVVAAANRRTGGRWPRIAGSDLIGPLLDRATTDGLSVGFFGGMSETHEQLRAKLAMTHPELRLAGCWAPSRSDLSDPVRSDELANSVAEARVDILVVSLGKPRQELWISQYGARTGARVLLAFGAVVDFLAGRVSRAPALVARVGMEWAWRLLLEPRRLARRYLIQGPPALLHLRTSRTADERSAAVLDWPGGSPRLEKADRNVGCRGSVLIPAHNEASVIRRTLAPLAEAAEAGEFEVLVMCNGCTDGTAAAAREFSGVAVIDIRHASKSSALNAGDLAATSWPRVYLDADVEISPNAVRQVLDVLSQGTLLAARPAARYETAGASRIVRSYYRARMRIPTLQEGLWGAGVYALSRAGHDRLGKFPPLSGDDFWVDQLFLPSEKAVVATAPVIVRTPRRVGALIAILRRGHRGVDEAVSADAGVTSSTRSTVLELARSIRGSQTLVDAVVYAALSIAARRGSAGSDRARGWERDDSSR